jgi:histone acetyltransferase (RNA polymerase elongator complex component)
VRIYPVCVLRGTRLAELYESGEYKLMSFETALDICTEMALSFSRADIRILRIGLHASDGVEADMTAGFYHPAFGELVRSRIVRSFAEGHLRKDCVQITVYAGKSMVSAAAGHKKSNKLYFKSKGITLGVKPDPALESNEIRIDKDLYQCI